MITIYKMMWEDYEAIKEEWQEAFDDFWTPSILKSELENKNSQYIIAKEKEKIVGLAGIWFSPDDAQIMNIVTKKTERKKGIGSLLLGKLIEMAKQMGKEEISLEVNETNIPAKCLYEKFHFQIVGIRKKYYGRDNAFIMKKTL